MKKEAVEEYAYIVFRHLICRINLSDLSLGKNPRPVEIVLYYRDFGLPVNMGAFCLDSKLYLVGGETLREGENLEWNRRFNCDWEDIFEALSPRMIVFDPSKRCIDTAAIPLMGAPKTGAKVSIIDGKAYVLSGAVYTEDLPGPRFECYDPRLNSWEPLPDPPFYRKLPVLFLYPHAIGRKIYVDTQLGIFYYDVDHKRRGWIRHLHPERFPLDFWGRSAEFDDYGVVIAYSDDGLVAYRDELLKHCQPILQCELEDVLPKPRSDDGMQKAYILQLGGGGRFCLVLALEGADVLRWDIHVVIFRVKMLQTEDDDDFVDAVMLHHHLYHVPAPSPDLFEIVDVFAMCERSKKHGLDRSVFDRSNKRQAKFDRWCERSKKHGLDRSVVDRSSKKQAKLDRWRMED